MNQIKIIHKLIIYKEHGFFYVVYSLFKNLIKIFLNNNNYNHLTLNHNNNLKHHNNHNWMMKLKLLYMKLHNKLVYKNQLVQNNNKIIIKQFNKVL